MRTCRKNIEAHQFIALREEKLVWPCVSVWTKQMLKSLCLTDVFSYGFRIDQLLFYFVSPSKHGPIPGPCFFNPTLKTVCLHRAPPTYTRTIHERASFIFYFFIFYFFFFVTISHWTTKVKAVQENLDQLLFVFYLSIYFTKQVNHYFQWKA